MAVQWFDGGDYLTSAVWPSASGVSPWDGVIGAPFVIPAAARTGLNGYRFSPGGLGSQIRKNLTGNFQTIIVGAAIRINLTAGPTGEVIRLDDNGSQQCALKFNSTGTIIVAVANGTTLGPTTYQFPANQFHFVETQVKVAKAPSGAIDIWVDGVNVLSLTGVGTQNANSGTNPFVNQVLFGNSGGNSVTTDIDDMYILDTTGGNPWNIRLGDIAVDCFMPTGAGTFTQWTASGSGGVNWQNEDNIPSQANTLFNFTSVTGNRDSFLYSFTNPGGDILAVMPMGLMETDGAGTRTVKLTARQAGVDALSPAYILGLSYIYILSGGWIMQQDVNGLNWTITNLSATEFGYELIS